jgi:predicted fused transcriptional regulator/phosphomethylpyrimidine kinase
MEITIFNGKTHYKWPCSIAMLVYRRVPDIIYQTGSKGLVGVFVEYLDDVFDDTGRYHPHSFQ